MNVQTRKQTSNGKFNIVFLCVLKVAEHKSHLNSDLILWQYFFYNSNNSTDNNCELLYRAHNILGTVDACLSFLWNVNYKLSLNEYKRARKGLSYCLTIYIWSICRTDCNFNWIIKIIYGKDTVISFQRCKTLQANWSSCIILEHFFNLKKKRPQNNTFFIYVIWQIWI